MAYTEQQIKKALGKARWEKVEEYSFDGTTIDIMFKLPFTHPTYCTTVYVNEPYYNEMSVKETLEDIKYFIDGLVADWDLCPYYPDGSNKQGA